MELNKKELKKLMYSFNTVSSRMMRVSYGEYNMILKKFLAFIDGTDIILDYIFSGKDEEYNPEEDFKLVSRDDSDEEYVFNFGPSSEMESYQIYEILKYILENVPNPVYSFYSIYGHSHWQDNVKDFNDRVVLVLINNIDEYLTKVGIDMGLDENVTWNVSGGQVNISNDNGTVNATQNNGVKVDEINSIVSIIKENLSELSKEDAETIIDSVEMIREEITKPAPKGKKISNGIKLLAPMFTIANGIPVLADNLQKFVDFVTPYIHQG